MLSAGHSCSHGSLSRMQPNVERATDRSILVTLMHAYTQTLIQGLMSSACQEHDIGTAVAMSIGTHATINLTVSTLSAKQECDSCYVAELQLCI